MNRVESAICRIRQKLPGNEGFVTLGSGCIVKCQHLATKCGWKNPNIIFTSNRVLTKEALESDRVFVAEFISSEKKGFETYDLRSAAETCVEIDSHELSFDPSTKTNGCFYVNDKHPVSRISLTAISAEHLDKRSFLKRMVKKSVLQTSRPIEYYSGDREELISEGFLYCFVIVEKPTKHKSTSDCEIRTFKFTYDRENKLFILEQFGAANCRQHAKEFSDEEKPYGAAISSEKGEFVGVLDFNEDRIIPLFVPSGSQGEVTIVNNNQNASSTSTTEGTSEGDHESVQIEAKQQSELETHVIKEHAGGSQSMSEGGSSALDKSSEPPTEETSSVEDEVRSTEVNKGQDVNPSDETDTKEILAEEADGVTVSEKADTREEREPVNEPLSKETEIGEERSVQNEVQLEPLENTKAVDKSQQNFESIQPNAADCHVPGSPKSEKKFPFEELNLPRAEGETSPRIREETYQPPDIEISEIEKLENQQSVKAEEVETSNSHISQTESRHGDIQQLASDFPEKTEISIKEEKEKGSIHETASQTTPEEVKSSEKMPELNILELNEGKLAQEMSGNLDDGKDVSDKPAPEDLSAIDTACDYDVNDMAGIKYETQSNLCPSPDGRLVVIDSEKEGVQLSDVTIITDIQDQIPNNVLQVDLESHEMHSGTDSKEDTLDLQHPKILETDEMLTVGISMDVKELEAAEKEIIALKDDDEELKVVESAEDTNELSMIEQGAPLVTVSESGCASKDIKEQNESKEEQEISPEKEECDMSFKTPELEKDNEIPENKFDAVTETEACVDSIAEDSKEAPALNTNAGAASFETKETLFVATAESESDGKLGNKSVCALGDEESKKEDSSAEPEGKNVVESQLVTPVVSSSGIGVNENIEDKVRQRISSGDEGNSLLDEQRPTDGKVVAEDTQTQEYKDKEPDMEESKSPQVHVQVAAPRVVVDAADDGGPEGGKVEAPTEKTSREENSCLSLGDDLGICVRSLSDMNVVPRALSTETLLSEAVTNDPVVLEMLGRHLDIEYRYGHVSCWRDVADLLAVPPVLYEHCVAYSKNSPTEDLFVFLAAAKPETTMHDMKEILKRMERVDVVQSIDKYLARCGLKDDIVVGSLVEKEEEYIVGRIAVKLDKSHPQNWKSLASGLDIPRKVFRNFGSQHEHNSALLLLKYLPIFDPELSVAMVKDTLDEIDRSDVVKVLDAAGIPDNDPLKDILDDVELMDQVSDLLNEEGLVDGKNWRHLAKELGVPREKRKGFEPTDDRPSPTKLLFKTIETFDPDITVEELILALVAMKRHDVLEAMKKQFESDDIDKILEDNNLLPPADDSTCSRLEAEGERELDYTESSDEHEGDYIDN